MRKIEARALIVHQRTLLLHVRAEHVAQRLVHQVRRGVIKHRRPAQADVDLRHHALAGAQFARLHAPDMHERLACLARILDTEPRGTGAQYTTVAGLAAGLRVERRTIEHDTASLTRAQVFDL